MHTVVVLLLLNAAWLVVGALLVSSLGELLLQLPLEMLPQWFLGLTTMAIVGSTVWLTSVGYERLRGRSSPPFRTNPGLVVADLGQTLDRAAKAPPANRLRDRAVAQP